MFLNLSAETKFLLLFSIYSISLFNCSWNTLYTETVPEAYITIKDHKEAFPNKISCRLINPSKSSIDKISKVILDKISNVVQSRTSVNQWKDRSSVIEWFINIKNKESSSFFFLILKAFTFQSLKICLKVYPVWKRINWHLWLQLTINKATTENAIISWECTLGQKKKAMKILMPLRVVLMGLKCVNLSTHTS